MHKEPYLPKMEEAVQKFGDVLTKIQVAESTSEVSELEKEATHHLWAMQSLAGMLGWDLRNLVDARRVEIHKGSAQKAQEIKVEIEQPIEQEAPEEVPVKKKTTRKKSKKSKK